MKSLGDLSKVLFYLYGYFDLYKKEFVSFYRTITWIYTFLRGDDYASCLQSQIGKAN